MIRLGCPVPIFDETQDKELARIIASYKGDASTLGNAIGALTVARTFGWRVARLIYAPATYQKYQKALGIDFKDWCPETTEQSERSLGYRFVQKAGDFWSFVRGAGKPQEYLDQKKELA